MIRRARITRFLAIGSGGRACASTLVSIIAFVVASLATPTGIAATTGVVATPLELAETGDAAPVRFRGRTLFQVRAGIGDLAVVDRARAIESRLERAIEDPGLDAATLRVQETANSADLFIGPHFVVSITDRDAHPLGRTRRQLAADRAAILGMVIATDLAARSWHALLLSAVWSVAALALAAVAVLMLRRMAVRSGRALLHIARRRARTVRIGRVTVFSIRHSLSIISTLIGTLRWLLTFVVVFAAVDFVLMRFPRTQGVAGSMADVVRQGLGWAGGGMVSFLPNLFYLAIIVVATRYLLAALRFIMRGIAESGTASSSFPPEWVQPTYQILRFFVVALALVIAFPYLPGSDSRAFQGVSVFVGVLLSLGSTAAIANVVAGIVLVYMRALRPGDRVKIGETTGDVIVCELLSLKILTNKNVEITVPNALVLGAPIVNYSRLAAQGRLILHTRVTIGYDAPWQQVRDLLVAAARVTPGVEADPAPFVLRTSLDDFYVTHEINVYTRDAQAIARIESDLHANILDQFNEAGVEIMSPHYSALRDGNRVALPDASLPAAYVPPAFAFLWRGRPGTEGSSSS